MESLIMIISGLSSRLSIRLAWIAVRLRMVSALLTRWSLRLIAQKYEQYLSDALDAISYLLYGVRRDLLLDRMHKRYADMIDEVVELWCFKKE